MKAIIAIWTLALLTAIGTVVYVDAEINKMVVENEPSTVKILKGSDLQPAKNVQTTARVQQTQRAAQLMRLSPGVEMTPNEMLQQDVTVLEVR